MRHVPVSKFKDNASDYIAAAERGEEIVITRHGQPAARLIAANQSFDMAKRREAMNGLAKLRDELRAEGKTATIDEMIAWKNEGRP
jgi:prevent-host-death family protein